MSEWQTSTSKKRGGGGGGGGSGGGGGGSGGGGGAKTKVCLFFIQGNCTAGSRCKFSHATTAPAAAKSTVQCKFYTTPGGCIAGKRCPFVHGACEGWSGCVCAGAGAFEGASVRNGFLAQTRNTHATPPHANKSQAPLPKWRRLPRSRERKPPVQPLFECILRRVRFGLLMAVQAPHWHQLQQQRRPYQPTSEVAAVVIEAARAELEVTSPS